MTFEVVHLYYQCVDLDIALCLSMIFLLHSKSEAYAVFLNFKSRVENLLSMKIKRLRSDGRAEHMSFKFQNLLRNSGIVHQVSCPYTPQQNGCAECKHRYVVETGLTMLFNSV